MEINHKSPQFLTKHGRIASNLTNLQSDASGECPRSGPRAEGVCDSSGRADIGGVAPIATPRVALGCSTASRRVGNEAGIAALGGETLFDLIDRPFESTQPSIRKLSEISAALKRSETVRIELEGFCESLQSIVCDCTIHALADGRSGLLVIAEDPANARSLEATLLAQAFDEQPSAAIVTGGEGLHANRAAREMFETDQLVSLASLMGGTERAEHLCKRVAHSGVWREVLPLTTKFGAREVKLTARRAAGKSADSQSLVIVIEDVSDRRALERQLAGKPAPAKSEPPVKSQKSEKGEKSKASRLSRADETAFNALGLALKSAGPAPPQPQKDSFTPVDLPQPILRRLDSLQEPTLIVQGGQLHYANAHAIELLGAADGEAILTSSELARAFDRVGEKPMGVAVPTTDGGRLLLTAAAVQIAWRGGPARQITLKRPEGQKSQEIQSFELASPLPAPVVEVAEPLRVPEAKQPRPAPAPAAREPDEELRTILDTAADGIITLASDGTIRTFSAAAEAIFGYRSRRSRASRSPNSSRPKAARSCAIISQRCRVRDSPRSSMTGAK